MADEPAGVSRVISVLELLAQSPDPMRLTEIARSLALPVSSTHVLLRSLTNLGYVELSTAKRTYSVGPRLTRLGIRIVSRLEIVEVARPFVDELAGELKEDVYLAVAESEGISYAYKANGQQSLRLDIQLGIERPLHATSVGKLYLAMQEDTKLEMLLGKLDPHGYTASTATSLRVLRDQITQIRRLGHAVSDQEMVEGIVACAAPILRADGSMAGAISVAVLRTAFQERGDQLLSGLTATAIKVSRRLGSDATQPRQLRAAQ
jgi:DNA-binding IclR family transcriptional regulator